MTAEQPHSPRAPVAEPPRAARAPRHGAGELFIQAGMLASRALGFLRMVVFAAYFGGSSAAGAFTAALRIPNFLQNLFGEGVLSASFIPVYASLIGKGEREEADRVAATVFCLLSLVTGVLVALGVLFTPLFVDAIVPGFEGEVRSLAILLVRILFPGTGVLVLSAWCLGILNSHRRFFLSYAAPVLWNLAMIAVLVLFGRSTGQEKLAEYLAWGTVAGSVLQFGVQVPTVLSHLGRFRPSLALRNPNVRQVLRSFGPVVIGRGVVQVSAFVDSIYASLISAQVVAALAYAQTLYLLPISFFGMAVSAAELPTMSQATGTSEEVAARLRERISSGLARIAFFVVPSATAFALLGDVVAGLLQRNRFTPDHTRYVWYLLMGSAVGLVAASTGRLYSSAFYALKNTRTPLYFAVARVVLTAALAYYSVRFLPEQLGVPAGLGGVGITATSGIAAWIEYLLLSRAMEKRIGKARLPFKRLATLWGSAVVAGLCGIGAKLLLGWRFGEEVGVRAVWGGDFLVPPKLPGLITAAVVLSVYGAVYFGLTAALGVPQSKAFFKKVLRRR